MKVLIRVYKCIKIACIKFQLKLLVKKFITEILTISTSIFSGITLLGLVPVTEINLTSNFGGFNAVYLFLSEGISIGFTSKKNLIEKFKSYQQIHLNLLTVLLIFMEGIILVWQKVKTNG